MVCLYQKSENLTHFPSNQPRFYGNKKMKMFQKIIHKSEVIKKEKTDRGQGGNFIPPGLKGNYRFIIV